MTEPIRTPEDWLHALRQWAQLILEAGEAEDLWQVLKQSAEELTKCGQFLPIPYLTSAFRLSEPQAKCLALVLLTGAQPVEDLEALFPSGGTDIFSGVFRRLVLDPDRLKQGEAAADERIRAFALDCRWTDQNPEGLMLREGRRPPQGLDGLAEQMADCFIKQTGNRLSYLLIGQIGSGRRALAMGLAHRLETPLLEADGRQLLGRNAENFRRSLLQEAWIQQCPVFLAGLDSAVEDARQSREAAEALDSLLRDTAEPFGLSLLACQEDWCRASLDENWSVLSVSLALPGLEESRALWGELLKGEPELDPDLICGKYRLTPGQMKQAVRDAKVLAAWSGRQTLTASLLDQGCRRQFHHTLGDKARRVETAFTWDQLILPEHSKELLRSACEQVRYRRRVYEDWGFGARLPYGSGLSMLFSGPPGTGKTMGAQVVAGALGLELYKVELPAVVSKYVGETEKNLSVIFHEASKSQAILFFDEADVLFGKRTEQKDAQDKYSNMEAAYLLQKMEEYSGISILATNFLENFDEAFKRRLKFIIPFPFPDEGYRLKLWKTVFPPETPVDSDVDLEFLAHQFELSGSAIKNTALGAAFLAAGENRPVSMEHLLTALCREMQKSGKTLSREELGPYYVLLKEDGHGI